MTTYAEKNMYPVDWNESLELLTSTEEMPPEHEIASLVRDSEQWETCAAGNQCDTIPRDYKGEPIDPVLRELGLLFNDFMNHMDDATEVKHINGLANGALIVLGYIESTSSRIIREMGVRNVVEK